ncbi:MAG: DNA polymerase III subunit beta [Firmicutes bacterium]|nr:DNA polymerase III subunit beta [Bacillota bacterium]
MIIKYFQESLSKHLEVVEKALPGKTTLPVLNNILVQKKGNELTFVATNLEIGIRTTLGVEEQQVQLEPADDGSLNEVLMPAKIIDIIRHLPKNHEVEINVDEQTCNIDIRGGESKFNLKGVMADEFPDVEEKKNQKKPLTLKETELKKMIRNTIFATSTEEARPAFTGVLFAVEGGKLNLIASDTYRLAVEEREVDPWEYEGSDYLVPARALRELSKLLMDDEEGDVLIYPQDNQLIFSFRHVYFITRLIEEKFPDFRRVIPTEVISKIKLNRADFEEIIGRASLVCDNLSRAVGLKLKENMLQVKASSAWGKMEEEMPVHSKEGEDIEILLNVKFLADIFKLGESENVEIEFSGREAPMIIRPENSKEFLYLVLPIKIEKTL